MSIAKDLRFAFRQLRRSPSFTLIVLATLGLCIGANTAVYSVLDAVLLRPVPYPEPEKLAIVSPVFRFHGQEVVEDSQTGKAFLTIRDAAPGLDVAAYSRPSGANLEAQGHPEYVRQQRVSAAFFHVLGIEPRYGREFTRAEDTAGGPAVAILSDGFCRRMLGADPRQALGHAIALRGESYTVIGVMPRGFRAEWPVDVWTPLRPSVTGEGAGSNYGAVARLKPGVSWAEANGQLQAISRAASLAQDFSSRISDFEERLFPYQKAETSDVRRELLIAWGAVLMVLLIACVNIAGLLLARSASRRREIATRMAVGGSRMQIVRQLLAESLVLALAGCAVGVGIGAFALDALKSLGATDFELWHPIALDGRVLIAMLVTGLLTSLVFGLAPALATSRIDIRSVLVEGGRGMAGGRRRWTRNAWVAGEIALSLILLVSAGLLLRTLAYFRGLNPGFDPRNVVAASASLQDARYSKQEDVNRLFTKTVEQIRRLPTVQSAAVALTLPYERPLNDGFQAIDGTDNEMHSVEMIYTTPGYFAAMRIPVLRGREFRESDSPASGRVAVASQSFANRYFHGKDALGGHVKLGRESSEIVGIAGDVQQHSGLDGSQGPLSMEPTLYIPVAQTSDEYLQLVHTWFSPKWVIRTKGRVRGLESQVRGAIAAADPRLPIAEFRTVEEWRGNFTGDQRYLATLLTVLAGLALLLSGVGLYGLIGHSITERTHEIGVRLALGATVPEAMASAMKPGLVLGAVGVAVGLGLSLPAARLLKHLLWGVEPADALTFLSTAAVLLAVCAVASLMPALRIPRLNPARTLRSE
jgi:predicted permease